MSVRIRHLIATFGWWQWLLCAMLVGAMLFAGLFAVRTVRYSLYWSQHRADPIERWMTVNYVAHSYGVPPEVLWQALGEEHGKAPTRSVRRPLSEVVADHGQTFEEVRATL
ncbi:MAG: hypothetical protein EXR66_01055 [Dehalococcoidia bacterium]|nr:hypothetical protein [Dehalococcoidia bacterium]